MNVRSSLTAIILLVSVTVSLAQPVNNISLWMEQVAVSSGSEAFPSYKVFDISSKENQSDATFGEMVKLSLLPDALNSVISDHPATMELEIPSVGNSSVILQLAEVNISSGDFSVGTKSSDGDKLYDYSPGIHYRGTVKGNKNSTACISFFQNELIGMFSNDEGTFAIGKMEDESENYVIYNSTKSNYKPGINCFTDESLLQPSADHGSRGVGCKEISVYFECDYKLYTDKGSNVTNAVNFVTGLFNQVATLYANENITVVMQSVDVWTSSDPYTSYSTASSTLYPFSSANSPFTKANLGHFLSTRSLGGGVASLNSLCSQYSCFAVSGSLSTSFSNVPTYSWDVEVIAHEMGHNIGSSHTHNCSWVGGPIDNCGPTAGYPTEGGCANGPKPTNGGTVMSYCHLVSGVGINFNNGFGTQPGDLLRKRTIAANCVNATGTVPAGLSVNGLSASMATLHWNPVAGVTTYTVEYKISASAFWINAGTTTAIADTLFNLVVDTSYNWRVKTECSNFTAAGSFHTKPFTCIKPRNLRTTNITASSAQLNWSRVNPSKSYVVQYRLSVNTAWIVAAVTFDTSYVLTGLYGSATYKWRVKSSCSDFTGIISFSTPVVACSKPTTLTSPYVGGRYAYLTWQAVIGSAYYTVYHRVTGTTKYIVLGTTLYPSFYVSTLTPNTSYDWSVKANCSANSSKSTFTTTSDTSHQGGTGKSPLIDFQVYPNPANEQIAVDIKTTESSMVTIQIHDMLGREVFYKEKTEGSSDNIDIGFLSCGMYFISLRDEYGHVQVKRLLKEKY